MHTREFAIGIRLPTHHVGCTDARLPLFLPFAARPFASGGHFSLNIFRLRPCLVAVFPVSGYLFYVF